MTYKERLIKDIQDEFGFCPKGLSIARLLEHRKTLEDNREIHRTIERMCKGATNV